MSTASVEADVAGAAGDGTVSAPALFCVVALVYNDYPHCLDAIDSILGQTEEDFQLVIVDNGSTDRTATAIARYRSDPRVSIVRLDANQRSNAVQAVAEGTRSEFFSLLFADDSYAPDRLKVARRAFEEDPSLDYVFFNNEFRDEKGSALPPAELPKRTLFSGDISTYDRFGHLQYAMDVGNSLHPCGLVVRSSVYRELGGFPNTMHHVGDLAFFVRLLGARHGAFRPEVMQKITVWTSGRNESAVNEAGGYQLSLERAQVLERWLEPGVFDNLERIFTFGHAPRVRLEGAAARLWFLAHRVLRCPFAEFQMFGFRLLYDAAAQGDAGFDETVMKATGFTPSQYISHRIASARPTGGLARSARMLRRADPVLRLLPSTMVRELGKLMSTLGFKDAGHRLWNHAADRDRMRSYR